MHSIETVGKELEEHITNGGNLEEMLKEITKTVNEATFCERKPFPNKESKGRGSCSLYQIYVLRRRRMPSHGRTKKERSSLKTKKDGKGF